MWYLLCLLLSLFPDLVNGFVTLPNYMLPESTGLLWEMLVAYKEVCLPRKALTNTHYTTNNRFSEASESTTKRDKSNAGFKQGGGGVYPQSYFLPERIFTTKL